MYAGRRCVEVYRLPWGACVFVRVGAFKRTGETARSRVRARFVRSFVRLWTVAEGVAKESGGGVSRGR